MNLCLSVIASQPGGAAIGTTWVLEGRIGVIGRGGASDWILPDPASHLSKRHCEVARTGSGFAVTDVSTNGVFVNGAGQALGKGNGTELADGDRLAMGDYLLEARFVAETVVASLDEDDPFGIADLRRDPVPSPALLLPEAYAEPEEPEHFSPFKEGLPSDSGGLPLDFDPFAEPLQRSELAAPAPNEMPPSLIPDDIDLFGDDPLPDRPDAPPPVQGFDASGASRPDNLAVERGALPILRTQQDALPDDWLKVESRPAAPPPPRDGGKLLAAFLAGAGLPEDALSAQDPAVAMQALGEAYRAAVLGVAEILRNRSEVKSEFRIERTVIGRELNNPLKHVAETDLLLEAMTGLPQAGFQAAATAFRDGCRDVQAHEMALVAAIPVALTQLLGQLDPEALKARLERRSVLDALIGSRKARYWELFETSYKAIAEELAEDFNGVFGKAFAEAYEEGARR